MKEINKNEREKRVKNDSENLYNINYEHYISNTCSYTECTGLIPYRTEDECWKEFNEIFDFGGYE